MIKTSLGYPDTTEAVELLQRRLSRQQQIPTVTETLSVNQVRTLQTMPESVRIKNDLLQYIVEITEATRENQHVAVGVSPRGTQRLLEAVRAYALIRGRDFVTPDDIKTTIPSVLAHRLVLTSEATVDNVSEREVVYQILDNIYVPTI